MKKDLRFQTIIAFIFMKDNSTTEIVNRKLLNRKSSIYAYTFILRQNHE